MVGTALDSGEEAVESPRKMSRRRSIREGTEEIAAGHTAELESSMTNQSGARDLRRRVRVETPENVVLDLEVAGLGSRALAALIDSAILVVWIVAVVLLSNLIASMTGGGTWLGALTVLILFGSTFGYFIAYEGFGRGQTPGKRFVG
ncbi:MAG: RDD family protein, partial [Gemmatimonadales bacterium]